MVVGFSTGSLAFGDVRLGLQMVTGHATSAVELSALREEELKPLISQLDSINLNAFDYISFHAPSRLRQMSERDLVSSLLEVGKRGWPIIVHPDIIQDPVTWSDLGDRLCLENMDKRKATGRTAKELAGFFQRLPDAMLCFDIGHARQIDPTMCEASLILRQFGDRLQQVHISLVNSESLHRPLNFESELAFRQVTHLIPAGTPFIVESPVTSYQIDAEIKRVAAILQS